MVPPREDHSRTDPAGSKAPLVSCGCALTAGVAISACPIPPAADCAQKKSPAKGRAIQGKASVQLNFQPDDTRVGYNSQCKGDQFNNLI